MDLSEPVEESGYLSASISNLNWQPPISHERVWPWKLAFTDSDRWPGASASGISLILEIQL